MCRMLLIITHWWLCIRHQSCNDTQSCWSGLISRQASSKRCITDYTATGRKCLVKKKKEGKNERLGDPVGTSMVWTDLNHWHGILHALLEIQRSTMGWYISAARQPTNRYCGNASHMVSLLIIFLLDLWVKFECQILLIWSFWGKKMEIMSSLFYAFRRSDWKAMWVRKLTQYVCKFKRKLFTIGLNSLTHF